MSHPHEAFLQELQVAIKKMQHYAPESLIAEAQKRHDDLLANPESTERDIHQALVAIGQQEFPYRMAYRDLCSADEEQRLQKLVMERLDPEVQKKVMEHTQHGVLVDHYVKSRLFETELTAEQRLQVENAILLADEVLNSQCDDRASKRKGQFETLIEKWKAEVARLQGMIDGLRAAGAGSKKWAAEINGVCDRLEEGWSLVERDSSEEEIKKEIEYWDTVLHEVEDESPA